jgi:DNA-binding transcriptional LysR family regulator
MHRHLLVTFLDVLETRNFHRTADRLDIIQSSVGARIRQLEAELGARLVERGRGGAEPTPAGRRFEAQCRALLAMWGQAINDAVASTTYESVLRISVQVSLLRPLRSTWTRDIRSALPGVALHLELDYSLQIMRDIAAGNIDVGIVYAPQYLPDLVVELMGA